MRWWMGHGVPPWRMDVDRGNGNGDGSVIRLATTVVALAGS